MKVSPSFLAPVALVLFAVTLTSCATPPERKMAGGATDRFRMLDADGDGKVTRAEFNAGFADRVFAIYNRTEKDGVVTKAEWDAIERANEDRAESSFRALDANGDGKLTRAELSANTPRRNAVVNRLFDRVDTNKDGALTLEEARRFGIKTAAAQDPANHP